MLDLNQPPASRRPQDLIPEDIAETVPEGFTPPSWWKGEEEAATHQAGFQRFASRTQGGGR